MSQINPLVGSIVQATGVQRSQAADKDRQLQRSADLKKNAGLSEDRFEHAVESAEALDPVHDEQKKDQKQKRRPNQQQTEEQSPDDESGLDLTA